MAASQMGETHESRSAFKLAPQVCGACKARKRKCDKTLPSCGSCERLLLNCRYNSQYIASDVTDVVPLTTTTTQQIQSSDVLQAEAYHSKASEPRLPHWRTSALFYAALSESDSSIAIDVMNDVIEILTTSGMNVPLLVSTYFQTIGIWFPIVDRSRFESRLQSIHSAPCSGFASLLLCMHIVTQLPRETGAEPSSNYPAYSAAKSLLLAMSVSGVAEIEVVQAYTLLALYEYGHGVVDAAHVSMITCARLGSKLRSHSGAEPKWQESEENILWWGIVFIDRYMNLGMEAHDIVLATGRRVLELPKDDLRPYKMEKPSLYVSACPTAIPPRTVLGPFCRAAEAANLLREVLEFISEPIPKDGRDMERLNKIDQSLQSLMQRLLEEATHGWEECCAAIGLCLGGTIRLHKSVVRSESETMPELYTMEQRARSYMALRTAIKISIDISARFVLDVALIDWKALPIPALSTIYQSALLHVELAGDDFDSQDWKTDMASLQHAAALFSKRWSIGRQYFFEVEELIRAERTVRLNKRKRV